uniref:LsmAD domain-containing protein n=1 Tax=Ditylenchus dipsaci TaxID=166011 RepID=A0A915E9N3_9BILA
MMRANKDLGVVSSFKEDLSQYTTVEAVGDEDQRRRADQIASQIESNASSRKNAALENDDYERDLDKVTDHPNRNRNGNDLMNASNRRGPKFSNNKASYPMKRFDKAKQNVDTVPEFMRKRMGNPPKAEVAPMPAATSSVKVSAVQPSLSSSATVTQKPTGEKTGPSASQTFVKSSNVISNDNSVSVEGHSRENSENLDQKEPAVAQVKDTDESQKGECITEGPSKSGFVFNPEAKPFVPTVKQESAVNSDY